jgi:DNA-binding CsgD family transcriptional regulator
MGYFANATRNAIKRKDIPVLTRKPLALTDRQWQAYKGRLAGKTFRQIGEEMGISGATVISHENAAIKNIRNAMKIAADRKRKQEAEEIRHAKSLRRRGLLHTERTY